MRITSLTIGGFKGIKAANPRGGISETSHHFGYGVDVFPNVSVLLNS